MFQFMPADAPRPDPEFKAWPEQELRRIGIWCCGGLQESLAARRLLNTLHATHPQASLIVLGPRDSLAFFEMDKCVAAFLPLNALEPPRPTQGRVARYLENRASFKKLRGLQLDACVSVMPAENNAFQSQIEGSWRLFVRMLAFRPERAIAVQPSSANPVSHQAEALQPGPQAIAYANKVYHHAPPRCVKVLVYLGKATESLSVLQQREEFARQLIERRRSELLGTMGHELFVSTLVVTTGNRLLRRQLMANLGSLTLVNWNQLIGHMAYVDWVLPVSPDITAIASEMDRQKAIFPL